MDFETWWKQAKPAECDELKEYFEECLVIAFEEGKEENENV